jgi:hypothetical protein
MNSQFIDQVSPTKFSTPFHPFPLEGANSDARPADQMCGKRVRKVELHVALQQTHSRHLDVDQG